MKTNAKGKLFYMGNINAKAFVVRLYETRDVRTYYEKDDNFYVVFRKCIYVFDGV